RELSAGKGESSLPLVAFGSPVRNWIKQQYGVSLAVLGLGRIDAGGGQAVAVLGANHPSYIWYAADPANNQGSEERADSAGLRVMAQDLSAACWQARMGEAPGSEPKAVLDACAHQWQVTDKAQTCELFFISVRHLDPAQASAKCRQPEA